MMEVLERTNKKLIEGIPKEKPDGRGIDKTVLTVSKRSTLYETRVKDAEDFGAIKAWISRYSISIMLPCKGSDKFTFLPEGCRDWEGKPYNDP